MEFLVGVRDDYREATREEIRMAEEFMHAPYSKDEVFRYYMIALARGLAGDVGAKQGYFCIGPSNAGKSTLVTALLNAFPGAVGTFDTSNLCNVGGDGDRARQMAWTIPLEFVRLGVGNEIDMNTKGGRQQKVNAIQYKILVNGGEDQVPNRYLYKEAFMMKIGFTLFAHMNDMPVFSCVDGAIVNRARVVEQDRKASMNPQGPDEYKMIPNGELYVQAEPFVAGLRALLFEAYDYYLDHGHEPPPEVQMSTQERVEVTNPMEMLDSLFEIITPEHRACYVNNAALKAAGWFLPRQRLVEAISQKQLGMSPAAVIAELKKHGPIEEVRQTNGKVFFGIRPRIAEMNEPGRRD